MSFLLFTTKQKTSKNTKSESKNLFYNILWFYLFLLSQTNVECWIFKAQF